MIKPIEDNDGGKKEYVTVPDFPVDSAARSVDAKLLDPYGVAKAPFTLPGFDGLPFRGPIPDLKEEDVRQPQIGVETHVDIFDLSLDADMTKYREIIQLVGHNYAQISAEERKWVQETKSWKIFLRWLLYYTYLPPAKVTTHG